MNMYVVFLYLGFIALCVQILLASNVVRAQDAEIAFLRRELKSLRGMQKEMSMTTSVFLASGRDSFSSINEELSALRDNIEALPKPLDKEIKDE